ncbi:hypothetical protein KFZ76_11340 [Methylovulum psychrotolerans]|uniref:DUF6928 family protein n=1 Tax=Methylovulum psychrotolerans TaxID=1704499 RepID=UPI001BFEFAE5|nr:hypothetical protein [Methylovulum psychrotolerans]MBT9098298.1 hypothetical protein [Methylovulum psychrotolerans]
MGAKTWMLAYTDGNIRELLKTNPPMDRVATSALAKRLFPSETLKPIGDRDLSFTCPVANEIYIGCFPGVSIIAAKEFGGNCPSALPAHFINLATANTVYLHAMHSVVTWSAYAIWVNGKIQRSLSVWCDGGILEDIGTRLPFEEPYWSGQHSVFDVDIDKGELPFLFDPLDFGEAALAELFGYHIAGADDPTHLQPKNIPLAGFQRVNPWWKLW